MVLCIFLYSLQSILNYLEMSTASSKQTLVALSVGTHTWVPTPESDAIQDEVLSIMRKHGVTRLDTARSYVGLPFYLKTSFEKFFARLSERLQRHGQLTIMSRPWERPKKRLEIRALDQNSSSVQRLQQVWAVVQGRGRIF